MTRTRRQPRGASAKSNTTAKPLSIAFVASEVHPFSKTGGLADVAEALPAALAALGLRVTVLSPWYRSVAEQVDRLGLGIEERIVEAGIPGADRHGPLVYRRVVHGAVEMMFVVAGDLYDRAPIYVDAHGSDYADNLRRFSFFTRAALEYCAVLAPAPDVFHANDWQTALLPLYLRTLHRASALRSKPSVFTIHNLGYQGIFPAEQLPVTGLGWEHFHIDALEFYGQLNLMKAGIVFADAVTTVSPTYAREIQSAEAGRGLEGVARAASARLTGILNGIDTLGWDPASDPDLPAHFDVEDPSGKARCKAALQRRFGLPVRPQAFLLGVVSRLDAQKGIPLVLDAMARLTAPRRERETALDVQLVVLGDGDASIAERVRALAARAPARTAALIGFDDSVAHQIEAGADAFLMPSAYEPCGLNQMYSQRYGTVPIVRATGGLADTVTDFSPASMRSGKASGFRFESFDADALEAAIRRAAEVFFTSPATWRKLMLQCMRIDHSWELTARQYEKLYRSLT